MIRKQAIQIIFILSFILSNHASAQMIIEKEKAVLAINWNNFMEKQDLIWNYLPTSECQGAFLGNGHMGLLIFKQQEENALIFKTTYSNLTTEIHSAETASSSAGYFRLKPKGKILKGSMRLDLWNAEAETEITTSEGSIHLTSFVHADEMVLINRATVTGAENNFEWEWIPVSTNHDLQNTTTSLTPDGGKSTMKNSQNITTILWYDQKRSDQRTLYVTINQSEKDTTATERGKNIFRTLLWKGYNRIRAAHRNWWHDYYAASFISLPDAKLENYYWIQMYKLGSLMRPDSPVSNRYGLWPVDSAATNPPQWTRDLMLPYWPLYGSNHTDMALSLERSFFEREGHVQEENDETIKTKKNFLNYVLHRNTVRKEERKDSLFEKSDLAWICHNLWLLYRHRMDDHSLVHLYPVLKQTVGQYLQNIERDSLGTYHLPAVWIPDYGYVTDYSYDLALLKWGCQALISISNRLQINDPEVTHWRHILRNIAPIPMDKTGLLIGQNTPIQESRSSYAHLIAVYPLYLIQSEKPDQSKLIEKSLSNWLSQGKLLQGYSYAGASSAYSAIRQGNQALRYLKLLTDFRITDNTLYGKNEQSLISPIAGAQSILDMLIQSWQGIIRVFPSLPSEWKNVCFYHLRTEGAFLVNAERKDGKTQFIEITNDKGELCTVELDFDNPHFETSRKIKITRIANRIYNIPIRKGESVRIYPQKTNPTFTIEPIVHRNSNFFGDNN